MNDGREAEEEEEEEEEGEEEEEEEEENDGFDTVGFLGCERGVGHRLSAPKLPLAVQREQ